jgi:hypothetical protein
MAGEPRLAASRPALSTRTTRLVLTAVAMLPLFAPAPATAQTVEITPLAGYRFGNDIFESVTNRPVDLDGAPVFGGVVNVDMGQGLSFEALFSRQRAHVSLAADTYGPAANWRIVVDQYLAGGRQEFDYGRVRPFLTGLLGLTRYAIEGDNEVRFTVGAGAGVKLPLQRRLGLRLDSRVFTTFLDVDARSGACSPGICLVIVNANVVWQVEFTADLVVVF